MSGLEPLAALGLVCNVLQLVEGGLKTVTLCKNAYRTGEPDPELSVYAQNLADTASSLTKQLDVSQKKTPARFLSQQQPRKRDRFGAVFRGIINKPEIDRLEVQLQKAKESLEADLLVGVFKRLEISKASSTSEKKLHDLIKTQVTLVNTQISDRIDLAEASTKTHVTAELASHESRLISHANQGKDTLLTEAEVRENSRRHNETYERLLRSFYYPDMNRRRNEIHSSHASTFHWIFEGEHEGENLESDSSQSDSRSEYEKDSDAEDLVCSSFVTWLKSTEDRYWISGKPGTGKSVLMKFIVSHKQTKDLLQQWQPDAEILAHFFWKVGSATQSSFKGFLCSLAYQIFSFNREHAMRYLQKQPDLTRKIGPGDWDNKDLQSLIVGCLNPPGRPFCLLIDGLDEFMDDDGVGILIDFLDNLRRSSRLEVALATSAVYVEDLVRQISFRSEGVFLWAVLVTRSIARGISNGDSKDDIHKRLLKTPKKLHELYLDMWTRLGEDSELYQCSTALIFKIVLLIWQSSLKAIDGFALATSTPTISILELMMSSSDDLWSTPVSHFHKLSATDLEQRCNELFTRLPIRTTDLFEVIHTAEHERPDQTQWADKSHFPVLKYDNLKVQVIHRTVYDFLIETDGGKRIMSHCKTSQEEISHYTQTQRSTAAYRDAN
ncbi:hypothetical protein DER46DRAFT_635431 [Fusarium sp. MPI-SDFR-AT-0072]|nr:hypothetical protein DER46DRAFT_635431 [Fusarium sp. MPI-SDFR-AT-0072]